MCTKKTSAAAICLALLLVFAARAEASRACADVGAAHFEGARRVVVAAEQRRRRRRVARRRMSKRTEEGRVAEGVWGGAHIRLRVSAGGGTVEFDCAHGEITEPLKTDADGRFDVAGTFTREGGPIRLDKPRVGRSARYSGRVEGQTLTFNVKLTDTDQETGTFTLTRGDAGRLWKCR